MWSEFWHRLTAWGPLDTRIAVTAMLTAMACSLPGLWLVLRRQSMMGDALSHTALPGVVVSMLLVTVARSAGWISPDQVDLFTQIALIAGAVVMGIMTTWLTELLQSVSKIDAGASLGVIFTGLFSLGLVLVRVFANDAHIDPDCVLYGQLESSLYLTWTWGAWEIPRAAVMAGSILLINLALTIVFLKELCLTAFDAELASTQGISARMVHYTHMALTAATVTAAFQSVGSILVIALLVVPAVTALQLSHRLTAVLFWTLVAASGSACLGQAMARTLPPLVFQRMGWQEIQDASSSGMVCLASGMIFLMAATFGPRGVLVACIEKWRLSRQIAEEDLLGTIYRHQESSENSPESPLGAYQANWREWWLIRRLLWSGLLEQNHSGRLSLTASGQLRASEMVRRHRLWESYMHKHFALPDDHLHESAHRIEHFIDPYLQEALDTELDGLDTDPHGRKIPATRQPPAP